MKQSVFDVLMYLFDHYLDDEEVDVESDRESLRLDLMEAGFPEIEVCKAFSWLEGLAYDQEFRPQESRDSLSTRVYSSAESGRLDAECRGFLLFLEQVKVLDATTRELVIDRVMALGSEPIDLEQLKWVVLMVLFNQPGQEIMFSWMEDFVLDREACRLH